MGFVVTKVPVRMGHWHRFGNKSYWKWNTR
jgi:hypothetical protein